MVIDCEILTFFFCGAPKPPGKTRPSIWQDFLDKSSIGLQNDIIVKV